jgi:hypothetical protein
MKPDGEDMADWSWIIEPLGVGKIQPDVPRASGWYSGRE